MELNQYRRQWVDELRNGEHVQGRARLATAADDISGFTGWRYCCLGVAACKVFAADERQIGHHEVLLDDFANRLGLNIGDQRDLVILNDDHYLSFAQIADVVERMTNYGETPLYAARYLGYVEE